MHSALTVKGLKELTTASVHGAGALSSCQTPRCSAYPAEPGSILAHESPKNPVPLRDWLSLHWSIPSLCLPLHPPPLSSSPLLMQQRLWCVRCPSESPLQQTERTGRGSCSLSLDEPANAAPGTLASFSAVCSIDGVAEGMLTQHEFSPLSAPFLPPLLSVSPCLSPTHRHHPHTLSLLEAAFCSDPFSLAFRCQRPDLPVKPDQRLATPPPPTALPGLTAHLSDWLVIVHTLCCVHYRRITCHIS